MAVLSFREQKGEAECREHWVGRYVLRGSHPRHLEGVVGMRIAI